MWRRVSASNKNWGAAIASPWSIARSPGGWWVSLSSLAGCGLGQVPAGSCNLCCCSLKVWILVPIRYAECPRAFILAVRKLCQFQAETLGSGSQGRSTEHSRAYCNSPSFWVPVSKWAFKEHGLNLIVKNGFLKETKGAEILQTIQSRL